MSISGGSLRRYLASAIVAFFAIANPAHSTIRVVNVINNQFSPSTLQINHGDTVRWIRQASTVSHTTTSNALSPKEWDSGTLQIGVPFDVQFTAGDGNGPFPYHCDFHIGMTGTITVQTMSVELNQSSTMPSEFSLDQNFPNPFNPSTSISFTLERASEVDFSVYNVIGERVDLREFGVLAPGSYTIGWSADSSDRGALPTGVYFYRLRAGDIVATRKMVLLK